MYKAIVFAGTTEGYGLCRFLAENGILVYACTATGYGGSLLTENEYLKIHAGRLGEEEMEELLSRLRPEIVLDATHPYAAEVTLNLQKACEKTGILRLRVLRDEGACTDSAVYVESTEAAVAYLQNTTGNVLVTTGSKELLKYTALPDYRDRLYARVLSLPSVMDACREMGLQGRHLIGMQGPFSMELNAAMLRQYDCRYLVTKDTGKEGGFQEKIDAALACGAVPVIIGRPLKEEGSSYLSCKRFLAEKFGIRRKARVTLLGIGMGSPDTLTVEGRRAVEEADLIIGARRPADAVRRPGQEVLYEYRAEEIADYIESHPEYERAVVALSGDVGFYSGAKKLLERLGEETRVLCGISSVVYFMAKLGLSWDDAKIVSAHGRDCNLIAHIRENRKVFALLGTRDGAALLARKLVYYGMGDVTLYVGENLSCENEKILKKKARELTGYEGEALSVLCAWNENPQPPYATHGLPDEAFLRGKAPMTKEEVRTVSLAKLKLRQDSLCYDVGAGTGSVSVEMALCASQGRVWAIEKKEEAAGLLLENKRSFGTDNLEIVRGEAPEALEELPPPTHAFIGGSSGKLREIVALLVKKNPSVRIVLNCITLETLSEAIEVIREQDFEESSIVQLTAARSKTVGPWHMMMGENPIYIITCQHREAGKGGGTP